MSDCEHGAAGGAAAHRFAVSSPTRAPEGGVSPAPAFSDRMDIQMAHESLRAEHNPERHAGCPAATGQPCVHLPSGHRTALPDMRRADPNRLERDVRLASQSPIVAAVLETSDSILLVLNPERQIVAFNGRMPRSEGAEHPELHGLRPGEAFGCVNAVGPGGCGAAPACETCGALGAIVGCQVRRAATDAECTIRSEGSSGAQYEYHARAVPVLVEDTAFTVLSLRDISAEKRRQVLEQLFFHDLLNTVAGLRSWSGLLGRARTDPKRAAERIEVLSRQIEREIRDQRALLEAENGALVPQRAPLDARDVLDDLAATFAEHRLAAGRRLELELAAAVAFTSDRALLVRTLVNAVCNALEATPEGGTVRCWAERAEDGGVRFQVQNPGVMPKDVQARVFQRSFSTKAATGRGLGTYSMKLFGERCLGGRVWFVSDARSGTVFTLALPAEPGGA